MGPDHQADVRHRRRGHRPQLQRAGDPAGEAEGGAGRPERRHSELAALPEELHPALPHADQLPRPHLQLVRGRRRRQPVLGVRWRARRRQAVQRDRRAGHGAGPRGGAQQRGQDPHRVAGQPDPRRGGQDRVQPPGRAPESGSTAPAGGRAGQRRHHPPPDAVEPGAAAGLAGQSPARGGALRPDHPAGGAQGNHLPGPQQQGRLPGPRRDVQELLGAAQRREESGTWTTNSSRAASGRPSASLPRTAR